MGTGASTVKRKSDSDSEAIYKQKLHANLDNQASQPYNESNIPVYPLEGQSFIPHYNPSSSEIKSHPSTQTGTDHEGKVYVPMFSRDLVEGEGGSNASSIGSVSFDTYQYTTPILENNTHTPLTYDSHKAIESFQVPSYFCKTVVADLLFIVVSAKGIRAADYNGKSDPYALVSLLNSKFFPKRKTKIVMKTLEPQWDESLWFHVKLNGDYGSPPNQYLRVELYDYDRMSADDFLASIDIDLKDYILEDNEATYEATLPFQKGKGSIRFLILWKTTLRPYSSRAEEGLPFSEKGLEAIRKAWNSCSKSKKKYWNIHEYTNITWIVCFKNFTGSLNPFSGALIYCKIIFSESFPSELPDIKFLTPFIHPNIDHNGCFVYKEFIGKTITPKKFGSFLTWIYEVLEKPIIEHAVNKQLASLYHHKPKIENEGNRYYHRIRGDIEKNAM